MIKVITSAIVLLISISNIKSQSYTLEWQDSIELNSNGYGINYPIIKIDNQNSAVYTATHQFIGFTQIVLVKHDFEGNKLWENIINYQFLDLLMNLKLDVNGNVYVQTRGPDTNGWCVIKYNPEGELLWHYNYTIDGYTASLKDFIVDENEDIYFVGSRGEITDSNGIITNAHLTKIDSNTELIWSNNFNFKNCILFNITNDTINILGTTDSMWCVFNCTLEGDSINLDEFEIDNYSLFSRSGPSGNFFIGAWYGDYRCTKINKTTGIDWNYQYTSGSNEDPLRSYFTEEDEDGNVYVVGTIYSDSIDLDILVTKLDINGDKLWELKYENPESPSGHLCTSLYIGEENIFITGFVQEEEINNKSFVLKISKSGVFDEIIFVDAKVILQSTSYGLIEDQEKNLYVTGLGYINTATSKMYLNIYKYSFNPVSNSTTFETSDFKIFPNPSNNIIKIQGIEKGFIKIFDQKGILRRSDILNESNKSINVSKLEPGIYYITIKKDDQYHTEQIIITNE